MTRIEERDRLARLIQRIADRTYPVPMKRAKVIIEFMDGEKQVFPIQAVQPTKESSEQLLEAELNVFGHVPDHDKPGQSSTKIMHACGLKSRSNFMKILKRLRLKGRVVLDASGYRKQK